MSDRTARQCYKVGAYGTVVSALCCLGALGVLLSLFGATAALAYVNRYGDFVFLPAYGAFAALFVYGMLSWKKSWLTYLITAIAAGFAVFLSLSAFGAMLTLSGIIVGTILIWIFRRS